MSYFNEDQEAHMRDLAGHPEKVCGCGWYWREECRRYCLSRHNQRAEDRAPATAE